MHNPSSISAACVRTTRLSICRRALSHHVALLLDGAPPSPILAAPTVKNSSAVVTVFGGERWIRALCLHMTGDAAVATTTRNLLLSDGLCAALSEEGWVDYDWDVGHGDGDMGGDSSLSIYRSWLTVSRGI